MNDAEAEAIAHQLTPETSAPDLKPDNVVADLSSCTPRVQGCTNSFSPSGFSVGPHLVQLALAEKLQNIHATALGVKAKSDHA